MRLRLLLPALALSIPASALATAHAAVGDVPTRWTSPQSLATSATGLAVADADAVGTLSVAVVSRTIGQGGGVGGVAPRADDGVEFDIYTSSRGGAWTKQRTLARVTVGDTAGQPQIATDGMGWAVTWQRAVSPGRWEVVVATSAQVNTAPTVTVLTRDFSAGYVQAPEPAIDGAPSSSLINGPRYLVAWFADTGLGTVRVEAGEMHSQRSWSASTPIQSYASTSRLSNLQVAYGTDRSAAIGYVQRTGSTSLLALASRAASGQWSPGRTVIDVGSGQTSGVWDLDMPETATHVSMAWASSNSGVVRYARLRLGTGVADAQDTVATTIGTADVPSIVVSDRRAATVVVTWAEQDAVSPQNFEPFSVRSYVTDLQSGEFALPYATFGRATGNIRLDAGMNDEGRYWLSMTANTSVSTSSLTVFEVAPAPPARFWAAEIVTNLTGTPLVGTQVRGAHLLVPSDTSTYPRILWAQSYLADYSLQSSQEVPEDSRAPGAPRNVTAVAGNGEATVRWEDPVDPGTSPITRYMVTASPGGATCTPVARACMVTGLSNGTAYTFTVVAYNAVGASPASVPSDAVTPSAAPAAGPLPPANLTVKAKPQRQVVVKWTPSPSAGVASYVVGISKNGGAWRERNVGLILRKTYTVKLNKTFCYRVAAVDAGGTQGDWTAEKCVRGRS